MCLGLVDCCVYAVVVFVPAGEMGAGHIMAQHGVRGAFIVLMQSDGLPRWGKSHVNDVGKVVFVCHGVGYFWLSSGSD
jgi:hypothetical protein